MDILRQFRLDKGFTQANAADYFECSQAKISLIEKGRRSMPVKMALTMSRDKQVGTDYPLERIFAEVDGRVSQVV